MPRFIKGHIVSEETRNKIRSALLGRKLSAAHIAKLRIAQLGHFSPKGASSYNWKGGAAASYNRSKEHPNYKACRRKACKRYEDAHREKVRAWKRISEFNRRVRSGGRMSVAVVQHVYEDNIKLHGTLTCYLCELPIAFGNDSIDHILPIAKGGTNVRENLAVACRVCNSRKKDKLLAVYKAAK